MTAEIVEGCKELEESTWSTTKAQYQRALQEPQEVKGNVRAETFAKLEAIFIATVGKAAWRLS